MNPAASFVHNRFAPVYRALGMIIMLFGLTMLAPLLLSYAVNDGAQTAYDEAFALTMLSGAFLVGYAIARSTCEFFREPDVFLGYLVGGITMGQLLCIPMLIAGGWLILRRR